LHIAAADGAPGLDSLVADIAKEFGVTDAPASFITMDDNNTDWNPLYPFSSVPYSQLSLRNRGLIDAIAVFVSVQD